MTVRLGALVERLRASLFFIPMLAVVAAIVIAAISITVDSKNPTADLPLGFTSTVDSARALLGTVAGATITFAGIAFSVSLLIIQQAANQYSPRVVHTLFRDPFNKRVMGLVVGTFTYCLLVLRSVRSPLDQGAEPVIPHLSVAIAVGLGIITILAIVAFIDHSAHSMDISTILQDVVDEATAQVRRQWPEAGIDDDRVGEPPAPPPREAALTIRFARSGWIQQVDLDKLSRAIPDANTMWVHAHPGHYAIAGTPLCVLAAAVDDDNDLVDEVRASVSIGNTRTMQQDVSFGLRQLADVALKALSPGVNDPTTAQDAIFHSGALLTELLRREPTLDGSVDDHGRVVLLNQPTHEDLIRLAFDEVRQAAATMPAVCIYLLEALALLTETLDERATHARRALEQQAALVVAGCRAANNLPADVQDVEQAHAKRFPGSVPHEPTA